MGQFVIQLAKLAGLRVATTASEYRWPTLKALGADVVADYKDPDVVKKIKEATGDQIQYGVDWYFSPSPSSSPNHSLIAV